MRPSATCEFGDSLVVWRLDRLGRSLKHLIETITALDNRQVGFKSITEAIDTTTSGGKLIFHIFGALAQFECDIIKERTQAGLTAARARGRKGARPKALTPKKVQQLQTLYRDKANTIDEICRTLNISRATLYRHISVQAKLVTVLFNQPYQDIFNKIGHIHSAKLCNNKFSFSTEHEHVL